MNRKNIFFLGLMGLLLLLAVKFGLSARTEFFSPIAFPLSSLRSDTPWFPTAHLGNNATIPWRFDPFIARLALLCPAPETALYGFLFLFYGLGVATLSLLVAPTAGLRSAGLSATIASALLMHLFGKDIIVLGALVWWPWVTLAGFQALRAPAGRVFPFLIILFFFALRATKSGSILAPYIIGSASVLAFGMARGKGLAASVPSLLTPLVALLPLALISTFNPVQPLPDYPVGARVVPPESAFGFVRALAGFERELPVIDYAAVAAGYKGLSITLLFTAVWGWILTRRQRPVTGVLTPLLSLAIALAASAAWDTQSGQWGLISPLRSLGRIVPELGLAPLVPLTTAIVITLLIIAMTVAQRITPFIVLAVIILGVNFRSDHLTWSLRTPPGTVHGVPRDRAERATSIVATAADPAQTPLIKNLLSPSAGVVMREGIEGAFTRAIGARGDFQSVVALLERIEASHGQERISALHDGDKKTRWTPQRGVQHGDEWLRIYFKTPLAVEEIELDPGAFVTDSPGGLRILDCSNGSRSELVSIPRWLGPLRKSAGGFLYYGDERAVRVRLQDSTTVSCLEVQQTKAGRATDWSIAELRILRAQGESNN